MLSEEKLEELRIKYGKVGVIAFSGHELVFRRPTREEARDYRRKIDSSAEKPDAMDQLAQVMLVAFDDELDVNRARTTFTGSFLEEYPLAISNGRFVNLLSALAGIVEEEDAADLGKGVRIKGPPRPSSPTG